MKKYFLFFLSVLAIGCVKSPVIAVQNNDWVFSASFVYEGVQNGDVMKLQVSSNKNRLSIISIETGSKDGGLSFDGFEPGETLDFSYSEGRLDFESEPVRFTLMNSSVVRSFTFSIKNEETGEIRSFSLPYKLYGSDVVLPESISIKTSSFSSSSSAVNLTRNYIRYGDLQSLEVLFSPSDCQKEFTIEMLDTNLKPITSDKTLIMTFPSGTDLAGSDNDVILSAIQKDTRKNTEKCVLYCQAIQKSENHPVPKIYLAGGANCGEVVLKITSLKRPGVYTYLRVWTRKRLNMVLEYQNVLHSFLYSNRFYYYDGDAEDIGWSWYDVFTGNSAGRVYFSELTPSFDPSASSHSASEFVPFTDFKSINFKSSVLSYYAHFELNHGSTYTTNCFLSHQQKLGKRMYFAAGSHGANQGSSGYTCSYCNRWYNTSTYECIGDEIWDGNKCSNWNFVETAITSYPKLMETSLNLSSSNGIKAIDNKTSHFMNIWNDRCKCSAGLKGSIDTWEHETEWKSVNFAICNIQCPKELEIVNFIRLDKVPAPSPLGQRPWFFYVESGKWLTPVTETFSSFGTTSKENTVYYY